MKARPSRGVLINRNRPPEERGRTKEQHPEEDRADPQVGVRSADAGAGQALTGNTITVLVEAIGIEVGTPF